MDERNDYNSIPMQLNKTAMQELIFELKLIEAYPMITLVLRMANDLLKKEKEQIIAARMNRMTDDELSYQTAEQYYNETYTENKTFNQNKFDPNFMHEWIINNGMRPTKEKE